MPGPGLRGHHGLTVRKQRLTPITTAPSNLRSHQLKRPSHKKNDVVFIAAGEKDLQRAVNK
jgi:hypothetical protein